MFLDGEDDLIKYEVGGRATGQRFWYSSLWIHPYELTSRRLLKVFPDKTHVFVSRSFVTIKKEQEEIVFHLPRSLRIVSNRWTHLAFQFYNKRRTITFFLNGVYMGWQRTMKPFMQMHPGEVLVGKNASWPRTAAFKGWVDEFKLIAENFNDLPEYACNQAHGSLYGVNARYARAYERLGAYPDDTPRYYRIYIVNNKLSKLYSYRRFGCEQNIQPLDSRKKPRATWCVGRENKFKTCMGEDIVAGAHGELFSDQPRPDQTNNKFCLYCHSNDSELDGMDVDRSLSESGVDAPYDPRRQPSQAPMIMNGSLPQFFQDQIDSGRVLGASKDGQHYLDFFLLKSSN